MHASTVGLIPRPSAEECFDDSCPARAGITPSLRCARALFGALVACAVVPVLAGTPALAAKKGLTVDDMLAMERVGEPALSSDGAWIVYQLRTTDVAANKGRYDLWLVSTDGKTSKRLTTSDAQDTSPAFSPDGRSVFFLSNRTDSRSDVQTGGRTQVWRIAVDGGEAVPVTRLPLDVGGFKLFPDGKRLLLALDVYPDAKKLEDTAARDDASEKSKSKVHAADQLLFRHWDTWEDGKFSHLFVASAADAAAGKAAEPVDLMRGQAADSPTHPFGDMGDTSISPDGKRVAYVMRSAGRENAWRTNTDIFVVNADGKGKAENVTQANLAYDYAPRFSPDGKTLAWLAMARPGYEADRQRVTLVDLTQKPADRKPRVLAADFDRSPNGLDFSDDGKTLYFSADNLGSQALYALDVQSGKTALLVDKGNNEHPMPGKGRLYFLRDTFTQPAELFSAPLSGAASAGELEQLTHHNDQRQQNIAWGSYEQFSFTGAHGDKVYGYVMKPAGFNEKAKTKVPVALLVHGGPQGSFSDHFHYRWNAEVFAGHGYGVVIIDFHGSTGYGQAFTDAINGDWGGAPFEDLMKGMDAALVQYPFLDGSRAVALGASYGGYMINWVNGHTDRFKALVCHDGNIDERMAYFDTEELWFPEWEHGGLPWEQGSTYGKHNPIDFVQNWKTPTLVIHGGNDYRVVDTQGMGAFTALQRRGIASRFLHFPEENHWVLQPQNSKRWHDEVLAWLDRYTKK